MPKEHEQSGNEINHLLSSPFAIPQLSARQFTLLQNLSRETAGCKRNSMNISQCHVHEAPQLNPCALADPKLRTEEQVNEIVVLRKALAQVEQHQAKLKEDMVYARGEVSRRWLIHPYLIPNARKPTLCLHHYFSPATLQALLTSIASVYEHLYPLTTNLLLSHTLSVYSTQHRREWSHLNNSLPSKRVKLQRAVLKPTIFLTYSHFSNHFLSLTSIQQTLNPNSIPAQRIRLPALHNKSTHQLRTPWHAEMLNGRPAAPKAAG